MKTIFMSQLVLVQSKEGTVTTVELPMAHSWSLPGLGLPLAQPLKPPASVGFLTLL